MSDLSDVVLSHKCDDYIKLRDKGIIWRNDRFTLQKIHRHVLLVTDERVVAPNLDIVINELSDTPDIHKRELLLEKVKEYDPIELVRDEEVDGLVKKYMEARFFPERYIDDARHIAVAVVNNIDIVVSWNQDHMVKVQTRFGVNGANRLEGYKDIDIATPEEVLKHEE